MFISFLCTTVLTFPNKCLPTLKYVSKMLSVIHRQKSCISKAKVEENAYNKYEMKLQITNISMAKKHLNNVTSVAHTMTKIPLFGGIGQVTDI